MARQFIISLALIFIAAFATVVSGDLSPSTSPSSSPAAAPSKSTSPKASPVPSAAPVPSTAKSATPLAAPVPSSTIAATPGVSPVGSAVKEPSSPPLPFDDTVGAAVPSVAPAVDVAAPGPSEVLADAPPSGASSLKVSAAVGATVAVGVLFF